VNSLERFADLLTDRSRITLRRFCRDGLPLGAPPRYDLLSQGAYHLAELVQLVHQIPDCRVLLVQLRFQILDQLVSFFQVLGSLRKQTLQFL